MTDTPTDRTPDEKIARLTRALDNVILEAEIMDRCPFCALPYGHTFVCPVGEAKRAREGA